MQIIYIINGGYSLWPRGVNVLESAEPKAFMANFKWQRLIFLNMGTLKTVSKPLHLYQRISSQSPFHLLDSAELDT